MLNDDDCVGALQLGFGLGERVVQQTRERRLVDTWIEVGARP